VSGSPLPKLVVFASGSGSNFQAIVEQLHGKVCDVALLVCDQPGAKCLDRARELQIPTFVVKRGDFASKEAFEQAILDRLNQVDPQLVALAGYMKIIGSTLLNQYEGRIINIHPALLPAFPGADAIGDALRYGVKVLGVTVHYVDAGVDTGKIIDQAALHLEPGETEEDVRPRIHALEHHLYPQVITNLLQAARG